MMMGPAEKSRSFGASNLESKKITYFLQQTQLRGTVQQAGTGEQPGQLPPGRGPHQVRCFL